MGGGVLSDFVPITSEPYWGGGGFPTPRSLASPAWTDIRTNARREWSFSSHCASKPRPVTTLCRTTTNMPPSVFRHSEERRPLWLFHWEDPVSHRRSAAANPGSRRRPESQPKWRRAASGPCRQRWPLAQHFAFELGGEATLAIAPACEKSGTLRAPRRGSRMYRASWRLNFMEPAGSPHVSRARRGQVPLGTLRVGRFFHRERFLPPPVAGAAARGNGRADGLPVPHARNRNSTRSFSIFCRPPRGSGSLPRSSCCTKSKYKRAHPPAKPLIHAIRA